jgi:hypothetical protein
MASLADLLRQGADKLVNLPTEAQRFMTNPQAFVQLLTGKNALPRETGFAAGATGLPAQQGTVLDPDYQAYMQGYEQGEPFGYAAMATPAVVPVAKALAPKAGQMAENYMVNQGFMPSIVAYHGTPHTIKGKFDISKVGTGEGAQAYGHGMYFAENPAVAKQYATDRSYVGKVMAGTPDNTPWDALRIAQDTLNVHGDNAITQLEKTLKNNSFLKNPQQVENNKQLQDAIDILKTNQLQPTGNLYKVDIPDADIPNMLNWDLPISQQPKSVQKAFQSIMQKNVSPEGMDIGGAKILDNRNRQTDPTQVQPWVMKSGDTMFGLTQKDVDQLISNETAKGLYGKLAADLGSQRAASEYLQSQGVKGIRYLDQGSRGKSGTSNFVVFDPTDVKILEQNSKPLTRKEILEQELKKVVE